MGDTVAVSGAVPRSGAAAHQPLTLASRLRKLRAMTAAEVVSRLGDRAFELIERRQLRGGTPGHDARLAGAVNASLRGSAGWRDRLLEGRASQAHFFPAFGEARSVRE